METLTQHLLNTILVDPTDVIQRRQAKEMRIKGDHTASRNLELRLVAAPDVGTQTSRSAVEGDRGDLGSVLVERKRRK